MHRVGIAASPFDLSGDLLEPRAAFQQQQRIKGGGRRRYPGWLGVALSAATGEQALDCRRDVACPRVEEFDLCYAAAAPRCGFPQRVGHQMPVGRVRRERRETGEAAFARIADLAHYLLPRQESHQIDIAAGEAGYRREGDDVYMRLLGNRLYRLDLGGEQRPENQPHSVADDRASGAGGASRIPPGVARD